MSKIAFEIPRDYTLTRDRESLKLVWHIECDEDQTLQTVRTMDGVPFIGARSPLAANLTASKIRFEMRTPRYFRAEAEYSFTSQTHEASGEDFAARPPEIRYFDESELVPLEFCYIGSEEIPVTPVLNSAGDRFPEVPLIPRLRLRIEISWYAERFNDTRLRECFNTLNANSITFDGQLYQAQTLWCVRSQSAPVCNAAGEEFTKVELTIRHDPENWNCKLLQAGYNAADGSGLKYPIRLADGVYTLDQTAGTPVTEPALLNESGGLLEGGNSAVYAQFRYLRLADWGKLDIPATAALHRSFGG